MEPIDINVPSRYRNAHVRDDGRMIAKFSDASSRDNLFSPQKFWVRVHLEQLSGLKADSIRNRRGKSKNELIVGYAEIAKSGKRSVSSFPLGPACDCDHAAQTIYWKSSKKESQQSQQLSKRKLQFSLKLEKRKSRTSNVSTCTNHHEYSPAIIQIVVGLQCGNEKYPLGVASLVVNGSNSATEQFDLALHNLKDLRDIEPRLKHKMKRNIWGRQVDYVVFKNHNIRYSLAANATFRVVVDTRACAPGDIKKNLWEDGEDASFATLTSPRINFPATLKETELKDTFLRYDRPIIRTRTHSSMESHIPPVKIVMINHESSVNGNSLTSDLSPQSRDFWSWIPSCEEVFECRGFEMIESTEEEFIESAAEARDLPQEEDTGTAKGPIIRYSGLQHQHRTNNNTAGHRDTMASQHQDKEEDDRSDFSSRMLHENHSCQILTKDNGGVTAKPQVVENGHDDNGGQYRTFYSCSNDWEGTQEQTTKAFE